MPMYVYACQGCGAILERRQSFQDSPLSECEQCGGQLRRVLQPVGVIFRGSGFYSTDYRSGSSSESDAKPKEGAGSAPAVAPTTVSAKEPSPAGASASSTGSD